MLKDSRTIKQYSEVFKFKVLRELETGKYTKNEVQRIYGISPGSIYAWIKKYGRFELLNKRIIVQTMEEKDKIKELENQIKLLKDLLVEKDLDSITNKIYLEDAAKQLGFKDADDFKKKVGLD